jgi:hypothetical protein
MPPPIRKDIIKFRKEIDGRLGHLMLADAKEEERFRRRMHLHVCLLSFGGGLALLSMWSLMDASAAMGLTMVLNLIQERLDYIGRV